MGYGISEPVAKPRRRTSSSSEKSASGNFFKNPNRMHLENRSNPLKTRQENQSPPTKIASGVLFELYRYTAFGEVEIFDPNTQNKITGSNIDNPTLWNSRRFDEQSGLYYYKYRHYKADIGRWLGRDPIEEDGGVNLYGFVFNRPIWYTDRLGLRCGIRVRCTLTKETAGGGLFGVFGSTCEYACKEIPGSKRTQYAMGTVGATGVLLCTDVPDPFFTTESETNMCGSCRKTYDTAKMVVSGMNWGNCSRKKCKKDHCAPLQAKKPSPTLTEAAIQLAYAACVTSCDSFCKKP